MNSSKSSMLRPALAAAALAMAGALPATALAQQVVRDAETGKLRAPTAEEAAALAPAPRAAARTSLRSAATSSAEIVYPDGTVEMATDDSHMMYSVVRRNADGSLDRFCVQGKEQAAKVSKAKSFAKPVAMTKTAVQGGGYELK